MAMQFSTATLHKPIEMFFMASQSHTAAHEGTHDYATFFFPTNT
jgi:hypothetical protein